MNYVFSEKDNAIRKKWLVTTLGMLVYSLLVVAFRMGSLVNSQESSPGVIFLAFLGFFLFLIAPSYFAYRCAYKKSGIRFLTVYLSIVLLSFSYDVLSGNIFSQSLLLAFINSFLEIIWSVFSFQLLGINRKIKRLREMQETQSYLESRKLITTKFDTASSLEELDSLLVSLFAELPQYKQQISDEYEKKKTLLLQPS